jgi:Alkylmercury lyase
MSEELDLKVKLAIYRLTAGTGSVPNARAIGEAIGDSEKNVVAAFGRLHGKRLLLPEPGDPTRIRMAPPFSGVETAFPVDARGRRYYANCVWDAYGIAVALNVDAIILARDGYSNEPLTLEVRNGSPILQPYVAHFAVPAAKWWADIVFT